MLYFHGNAEDIGLSYDMLYLFGQEMKMHCLAIEYPGYGLYRTHKPDEDRIREDADIIYDYLTMICGVRPHDIILFGRSMGSGPSSYLASKNQCGALLLMSPFMSIKTAAKAMMGWASFMSFIVDERFNNMAAVAKAKCPVFLLHGLKDTLIPYSHSVELNRVCPTESYLHLPEKMDHNEFMIMEDLVQPFLKFMA